MEPEENLMEMRLPFPKRRTAAQSDGGGVSERRKQRLRRDVDRHIERHLKALGVPRPAGAVSATRPVNRSCQSRNGL